MIRTDREAQIQLLPAWEPAYFLAKHPAAPQADYICQILILHDVFLIIKGTGDIFRIVRKIEAEFLLLAPRKPVIVHGKIYAVPLHVQPG